MEKTKINENEKGENVMILDGKYELGRVIGHGSFAKVYLAKNVKTGQTLAMKIINKDKVKNLGQMEQIKREISVMNMVKHPNIVELYEVMASKKKIYLAMELVKGGELFAKIVRGRMREDVARNYFQQLISAVDFCHSRGVYHRDLKPENLMLDEDGNLKVTDFGLSALNEEWRKDGLLHTTCGTPAYVAPEVLRKKGYDGAKADVWSCGVILFALLAGFLPFQDHNLVGVYTKICKGEFKCPSWFSSDSKKIVHRLLDCNPETRINIGKLMESNWFKKGLAKKGEEKAVEEKNGDKGKEPQTMNAFHLISFSKGFNLSGLFQKKEKVEKEEIRFGTLKPVRSVISKLEELAKGVEFNVKKTDSKVRLEAKEYGRKGKLGVAAEFYPVTPLFMVVEVKKERGDTLEYNDFCKELRPALKDIVWSSLQDNEISACNQD